MQELRCSLLKQQGYADLPVLFLCQLQKLSFEIKTLFCGQQKPKSLVGQLQLERIKKTQGQMLQTM